MVLAALLFIAAGALNGVYPGGAGWIDHVSYAWLTYVFGALNFVVALWIWRGSERGLLTRIVLAAGFLGVVAALAAEQPTLPSVTIYSVTGLIEFVIFLEAIRVWRLGHEMDSRDLESVFALDAPLPVSAAPQPRLVVARPTPTVHVTAGLSVRLTWALGLLSLALAGVLVIDGVVSGFVPGGVEWGLYGQQSGWLVYLFALVVLVVAVRAVHGSTLSLRLLLLTGLIVFIERPFSPFALGGTTITSLAVHLVAALLALALAITSVAGVRSVERARRATARIALDHAAGGE